MNQLDLDDDYLTVPGDYECPPMCGSLFIEQGTADSDEAKCGECPRGKDVP